MRRAAAVAAAALACGALAACGGSGGGSSSGEVTVGASLPLTGALAGFGSSVRVGYEYAVAQVNQRGGLRIDGARRKVKLVVQDNASDPNKAASQARTMVLDDGAAGLLGSFTPPLNIPISNVAESQKVPLVTSFTPEQAWLAANKDGWKYAWDMFFDELQMTDLQFKTADLTATNKRIALFTDSEDDGVAMGALWESKADKLGYTIAYHAKFPVGTTEYSDFIAKAKRSGADVVIAQMIPPDAFALWKQMKSLGFQPKVAFCEKCAAQNAWLQLGPLADGTSVASYWSPSNGGGSDALVEAFRGKYTAFDLAVVAAADSVAEVLLDAIEEAGSTDGAKINDAIRATDGEYPLGHVRFDAKQRYPVKAGMAQWQGSKAVPVYPRTDAGLRAPVAGLG